MTNRRFIFSSTPSDPLIQRALESLKDVRQYQDDFLKYGHSRVYQHFEDVEGDWLEKWEDKDQAT